MHAYCNIAAVAIYLFMSSALTNVDLFIHHIKNTDTKCSNSFAEEVGLNLVG